MATQSRLHRLAEDQFSRGALHKAFMLYQQSIALAQVQLSKDNQHFELWLALLLDAYHMSAQCQRCLLQFDLANDCYEAGFLQLNAVADNCRTWQKMSHKIAVAKQNFALQWMGFYRQHQSKLNRNSHLQVQRLSASLALRFAG